MKIIVFLGGQIQNLDGAIPVVAGIIENIHGKTINTHIGGQANFLAHIGVDEILVGGYGSTVQRLLPDHTALTVKLTVLAVRVHIVGTVITFRRYLIAERDRVRGKIVGEHLFVTGGELGPWRLIKRQ